MSAGLDRVCEILAAGGAAVPPRDWLQRTYLGRPNYRRHRGPFLRRFAYSVPCAEVVRSLEGPLLEVGAGSGWWAAVLAARGVDIIATDPAPPRSAPWRTVLPLAAEDAVEAYPHRHVLAVWPTLDPNWVVEIIPRLRPDRTVYLVEPLLGELPAPRAAFAHRIRALRASGRRPRIVEGTHWHGLYPDALWIWKPSGAR